MSEDKSKEVDDKKQQAKDEIDKEASRLAKKMREEMGIDELKAKLDEIPTVLQKKAETDSRLAKILVNGVEKNVDKLKKEEKSLLWMQGVLRGDNKLLKALGAKALNEGGAGTDGGYLFPDEFRAELIREIANANHMRSLVRVLPMKRDVMKIPGLISGPEVYWTSELSTKHTTSVDFKEHTLTAYKMGSILNISDELLGDCDTFDILALVRTLFAERIAREEDRVISVGSGTGQPTGLSNCGSFPAVTCSGNLDFNDIIDLMYTVPAKYRIGASFLVHNENIGELRKVQDGNNRYIWQDAVAPGQPDTIYGYPVYENQHIGEATIYFGNWKEVYILGDRQQMTLQTTQTTETAWYKDLTSVRVVERIAGTCVNVKAGAKLQTIP
jgi:HK97 family phage major capsid protein